jgi:hypothetical protein
MAFATSSINDWAVDFAKRTRDMSGNNGVRSTTHEEMCLGEIWVLLQAYRACGRLCHDDLVTLTDLLPCPDVSVGISVTEDELRAIRRKSWEPARYEPD